MSNKVYIPQMRPLFGTEERSELIDYLNEDGFFTEFERTRTFEGMISDYVGSSHCVVVNNGTVSLTLAALALGIGPGDEVIVPNYTMIATPNSIKMLGAIPVFVDVEPETLTIDISQVYKRLTPKTKAIILVSANGREPRAGIKAFEKLSIKTGIPIIEDAAQSLGSFYSDGRHIGTAGVVGSISFSAPKIISTGQGGAVFTNDDALAHKLRLLKDFGREVGGVDTHGTVGFNFKFTELQACVGIAQMRKLPSRVDRKKEIWQRYLDNLKGCKSIELFEHDLERCAPWFIDCMAEQREGLIKNLTSLGVGTRVMYPPINAQIAYQVKGSFPVSEEVGLKGLWLPSMVQLTNIQIDLICEYIIRYYNDRE